MILRQAMRVVASRPRRKRSPKKALRLVRVFGGVAVAEATGVTGRGGGCACDGEFFLGEFGVVVHVECIELSECESGEKRLRFRETECAVVVGVAIVEIINEHLCNFL